MLAFKSLERASLASLCSEADRLGVSKDGTRFEILIRVAAKQRPDLIAADKSEQQGAEPRVDGPGKEAVQEAVPVLDLLLDEAEDTMKAEVEKRLSSSDANKQNALVGAFVRHRMPESFSCLRNSCCRTFAAAQLLRSRKNISPGMRELLCGTTWQSMMIRSLCTAQSAARQR